MALIAPADGHERQRRQCAAEDARGAAAGRDADAGARTSLAPARDVREPLPAPEGRAPSRAADDSPGSREQPGRAGCWACRARVLGEAPFEALRADPAELERLPGGDLRRRWRRPLPVHWIFPGPPSAGRATESSSCRLACALRTGSQRASMPRSEARRLYRSAQWRALASRQFGLEYTAAC